MKLRSCGLLVVLSACGADPDPDGPQDAGVAADTGSPMPDAGDEPRARRVLFVVKNANSMGAADPDRTRKSLIEDAIAELSGDDTEIGVLVYSDGSRWSGFAADPATDGEVAATLSQLDSVENLGVVDGALRRAHDLLEAELRTEPEAEYDVVVMTDGYPTPTCTDGPDINPLCDNPRSTWMMWGVDPGDPNNYYEFDGGGGPYNRPADVVAQVNTIAALSADLSVHMVLLYTEAIVGEPIETALGLDRTQSESLLMQLANLGRGRAELDYGADVDWPAFLGP